jgi:GntR family carbon starvation induced transcriptional regulator
MNPKIGAARRSQARSRSAAPRLPRTETFASTAYERLRREIISGDLAPGAKLHIQQLCKRYGIGLSPLREALNRVSRDGLVRQNDLRGFSVAPLSEEDVVDLTRARCWINEIALRQSIAHGDAAWEEGVVLAYHRMSRAPKPGATSDSRAWSEAHRAFHSSLIAACGSRRVLEFCEQLFDSADRYRFLNRERVNPRRQHRDDHRPIMEAVVARDADKAVQLLMRHFQRTEQFGREELQKLSKQKGKKHHAN